MNYSLRLKNLHSRCVSKFGADAAGQQLYVWHAGTRVMVYQPSGTRTRDILAQSLVRDEMINVIATKDQFTAAPKPGDVAHLGTDFSGARKLRITDVKTTHIRPFYELTLMDPNLATTA